jgi:hypothetical protein
LTAGVAVLGEDARAVPYAIRSDKRTFYYLGDREAKSNGGGGVSPTFASDIRPRVFPQSGVAHRNADNVFGRRSASALHYIPTPNSVIPSEDNHSPFE